MESLFSSEASEEALMERKALVGPYKISAASSMGGMAVQVNLFLNSFRYKMLLLFSPSAAGL